MLVSGEESVHEEKGSVVCCIFRDGNFREESVRKLQILIHVAKVGGVEGSRTAGLPQEAPPESRDSS